MGTQRIINKIFMTHAVYLLCVKFCFIDWIDCMKQLKYGNYLPTDKTSRGMYSMLGGDWC
jgi:hypothetical protein